MIGESEWASATNAFGINHPAEAALLVRRGKYYATGGYYHQAMLCYTRASSILREHWGDEDQDYVRIELERACLMLRIAQERFCKHVSGDDDHESDISDNLDPNSGLMPN